MLLIAGTASYSGWQAYRWLTGAEMFQIAAVDVKGVRRVSEEEIREIASVFTGLNVFRVDLGAAAARAAANPWVKDVSIHRRLPNRISMVITEREPAAVLEAANGRYLIDGEGTVIAPAGGETGEHPTIALRSLRAELREQATAGGVQEALELLSELELRGGWDMGEVTVKAETAETVALVYAGHEFRVGSGNYPEKLRRLGEIVSDMNERGLAFAYVDLRPERQAAVMVKKDTKMGR
jgi:cell division protein FtsQ